MNTLRRSILALGLLVAVTIVTVSAFAQQESAEAAVERYIGSLLKVMTEIQPLYRTDRDAYFDAVENSLSEFVDFREVARGVMAKYGQGSNGASPAQLDRFADVFRESLVEFYGSALAEYGGVEFEILKNQQQSDNDRASNVRMFVLGDDGNRIEVQYSMFLNDEDMWKLRNLYVEGVNLRRQYYSKFDNLMTRNNFDIDKVIDRWQIEE